MRTHLTQRKHNHLSYGTYVIKASNGHVRRKRGENVEEEVVDKSNAAPCDLSSPRWRHPGSFAGESLSNSVSLGEKGEHRSLRVQEESDDDEDDDGYGSESGSVSVNADDITNKTCSNDDRNDLDLVDMWSQMDVSPTPAAVVRDCGGASIIGRFSIGNFGGTAVAPRFVRESSAARTYQLDRHKGIKVIDVPLHDQARRDQVKAVIERERRASGWLPPSCPARRVSKVEESPSSVSFHFEWVGGIALEEWLRDMKRRRPQDGDAAADDDLKSRLQAAIVIAKTLSDYHEVYGVAHGGLSASSILLETYGTAGSGGSNVTNVSAANFVDLSRAVLLTELGGTGEEEEEARFAAMRKDLGDLGRVFQRLFGGDGSDASPTASMDVEGNGLSEEAMDSEDDDRDRGGMRKKRGKSSTEREQVNEGLPMYVASLISALLANDDGHCPGGNISINNNSSNVNKETYTSARSLLSDLRAALDKFNVYFRPFDWKEASLWNHLPVPDHGAFYGRATESSILMNSLRNVADVGRPMLTVVSGHAGMGKTTLVNQVKKAVEERKGYLIGGKFDMADGSRPDSVLFEALDTFFRDFAAEGTNDMKKAQMRQRIMNMVGFGISDLIQSIPNLGKLVPNDCKSDSLRRTMPQQLLHRSKFLLCKLISAIADADNPIVLVMDDLQWADATSLSMIEMIVTDPDIRYCLYVGCYRDNESSAPTIETMISDVKSQGVNVFTINLGPLEKESVNTLVSESMCLPPGLSLPLSAIIHSKTAGSPLFCVNFLSDGLIRFNLTTRRWDYDVKSILTKEIPPSVVQYMKSQMDKLPQSYRLVLKLASCLGHHFDYATFLKAKVRSDYDLDIVLPHVCQIGFLHELAPRKYMWAHDNVRQAAYELIPENKRESFHLLIGTRILMNTPEDELDTAIFDILGHMNKGIRLIQTNEQRYEIARINLMAGESCIKTSSFHSAADYFTTGIKLLPGDCWACEYKLTVRLHEAAQDAVFATGDFPKLRLLNSRVITNAKTFDDKLHSLSLGQADQAISNCKSILRELEEPIDDNENIFHDFMTVKKMLGQYSGQDMLALPRMTDTRKLAAMEFLQSVLSAGINSSDPRVTFITVIRLVKNSLEYGLCDVSAFTFASFGSILVHGHEHLIDYEGGFFYCNLALQILNLLEANRFKARVFTIVYGFVNIWRNPFQASLDNLLEGYNAGCVNGDMEYAYWCLQSYSGLALYTGQGLSMLQNNMRTYVKRAMNYKQMGAALGIVPFLYAVLELTGDASKEDIYNTFFNTTADVLFQQLKSQNDVRACMLILNNRKFTCILKGDVCGAVEAYELSLTGFRTVTRRTMPYIMNVFADGLIALSCARMHGEDEERWTTIAEGVIETMKTWKDLSKWNFANKLYLLEAEYDFLKRKETALEKYEASISAARSHRFIHEEGLAFSLCGQCHLAQGRTADAQQNFVQAKKCYKRWGAHSLVQQMDTIGLNIA